MKIKTQEDAIEALEALECYLDSHLINCQTITLKRYEIEHISTAVSDLLHQCIKLERLKKNYGGKKDEN